MIVFNNVWKLSIYLHLVDILKVMLCFSVTQAAFGTVENKGCFTGSTIVDAAHLQFTVHPLYWYQSASIFRTQFNVTRCADECRHNSSFRYMAVAFLVTSQVLGCRCIESLPLTGNYTGEDAATYCGYRCAGDSNFWCIEKDKEQRQDRMMAFLLQNIHTTVTTHGTLTTTKHIISTHGLTSPLVENTAPTSGDTTSFIFPFTQQTQESTSRQNMNSSKGLSTTEIAGMTFGVIVGVGLVVLVIVVVLLFRSRKGHGRESESENGQDSNQNLYDYTNVDKMDTEKIDPYEEWGPGSDQPSPSPPVPVKPQVRTGNDDTLYPAVPGSDQPSPTPPVPVLPKVRPGNDGSPDGSPPPPPPADPVTEDVYAQPDMEKKAKARRPDSEAVSIVDNDLYGENAGDDGEENTYYNTAKILQPTDNNRPDTIFPPKQTDDKVL